MKFTPITKEVFAMSILLKRLATVPMLLGTFGVSGFLTLLFLLKVPDKLARAMGYTGKQTVFALDQHPYTPEDTYTLLADYGEAGRRATVLLHVLFDMVYPVSYALFWSVSFLLMGRSIDKTTRLWRWVVVVPWLTGLSDLLENTGIIAMALSYPSQQILRLTRFRRVLERVS
jgi:hypothetical protein